MPRTATHSRPARPWTKANRSATSTGRPYDKAMLAALTDAQVLDVAETEGLSAQLESDLRLWAFHVAHNRLYAEVPDGTLRFGLALVASIRPMRNRTAATGWLAARARVLLARPKGTLSEVEPFTRVAVDPETADHDEHDEHEGDEP